MRWARRRRRRRHAPRAPAACARVQTAASNSTSSALPARRWTWCSYRVMMAAATAPSTAPQIGRVQCTRSAHSGRGPPRPPRPTNPFAVAAPPCAPARRRQVCVASSPHNSRSRVFRDEVLALLQDLLLPSVDDTLRRPARCAPTLEQDAEQLCVSVDEDAAVDILVSIVKSTTAKIKQRRKEAGASFERHTCSVIEFASDVQADNVASRGIRYTGALGHGFH